MMLSLLLAVCIVFPVTNASLGCRLSVPLSDHGAADGKETPVMFVGWSYQCVKSVGSRAIDDAKPQ